MSLTSMLDNDKEFGEIFKKYIPKKNDFVTNTGTAPFSKQPYLVPYNLEYQYNSINIGTAFDYMARLIIAKEICDTEAKVLKGIAASRGLALVVENDNIKGLHKGKIIRLYEKSEKEIKQFINNKKSSYVDIVNATCFLAKLEAVARTGGLLPKSGVKDILEIDEEIKRDVMKMSEVFNNVFIVNGLVKSTSDVVFNPMFGITSLLVGGADADVYIDGVLYDFKSSKNCGYRWKDVAQLYGYYLLDCINKINPLSDDIMSIGKKEIKELAIYSARFGIINSYPIYKVSKKEISELLIEFTEYLRCSPNNAINRSFFTGFLIASYKAGEIKGVANMDEVKKIIRSSIDRTNIENWIENL